MYIYIYIYIGSRECLDTLSVNLPEGENQHCMLTLLFCSFCVSVADLLIIEYF